MKSSVFASDSSAIIGLVLGCVLFGMGSLIVATVPLGAYAIAFWRLIIAAAVFAPICIVSRKPFPQQKTTWFYATLSGLFLAWDLALWHESIYAVGPGISTLLNSLQVFFLVVIGLIFFHEKPTFLHLISLILAVGGVALIAYPEFQYSQHALWGLISGLASGACLALSMSSIRKTHQNEAVHLMPLMLILSVAGAIALLPMAWWDNQPFLPISMRDIGLVLVYGIVMQCLAWGLIAYSIGRLSLALTGLILLSEPVAALMIDVWILDKPIVLIQYIGCAITLFAIYSGSIRKKAA